MSVVVGIRTRLRAGRSELHIPVEGGNVSTNYPVPVRDPPSVLFDSYLCSFSGIKRQRCKFNPQTSDEFKNEWTYTSIPPTCPHGVDIDKFTFSFYSYGRIRGAFKF